jgi:hypothetical protein
VPQAVEGDAGDPSTDDGRLPDPATEQATGHWTAPRAVKTNASDCGPTKFAWCSSSRRITDRATGTVRLEREVFGSLPRLT